MMRSWQSCLAIGKGRPLASKGSQHLPASLYQFHETKLLDAEEGTSPEGVPYNSENFSKSNVAGTNLNPPRATSRRERSAAVSKGFQSLNENRSSNQQPNPSNLVRRFPFDSERTSKTNSPRTIESTLPPTTSRYPQGSRPAYTQRSPSEPNEPRPQPPRPTRDPQGGRPAYIQRNASEPKEPRPQPPRLITRVPQGLQRSPPSPGRHSQPPRHPQTPRHAGGKGRPQGRPQRRPRRNKSDSDFDAADFDTATASDIPSVAQARHYLALGSVEAGRPVPFAPRTPRLRELLGMPMGLYAAASGAVRAVEEELRAKAEVRQVAVGGVTGVAGRLLERKEVLVGDEEEKGLVLARATTLASERARTLKGLLVERATDEAGVLEGETPKVGVQKVGWREVGEKERIELVRKAVEGGLNKDIVAEAQDGAMKTVARYLSRNGTYSAGNEEALMKKVKELLPVATKQGGQGVRQATR